MYSAVTNPPNDLSQSECLAACRTLCVAGGNWKTAVLTEVRSAASLVYKGFVESDVPMTSAVKSESLEIIGSLLRIVDSCYDDGIRLQMTKIFHIYLCSADSKNEKKRLFRSFTSLNGTQIFLKVPLSVTGKDQTTQELVKCLTEVYLLLQSRDRSFAGKFRLSGVMKLYCQWTSKNLYPTALVPMLNLIVQSSWNHPRNCQFVTKNDVFITYLLRLLSNAGKQKPDVLLICLKLIFLVIKSRKINQKLVLYGVIGYLLTVINLYFDKVIQGDAKAEEICLLTVASLRILAKTKSGKDTLIGQGCPAAFLVYLKRELPPECNSNSKELLAGICALSLRCLPIVSLPFDVKEPVVVYELPLDATKNDKTEVFSDSDEDHLCNDDVDDGDVEGMLSSGNGSEPPKRPKTTWRTTTEISKEYKKFFAELKVDNKEIGRVERQGGWDALIKDGGVKEEVRKSNSLSEVVPSRASDESRMMRTVRTKRVLSTSAEPIRIVSASAFSSSTIVSGIGGLGNSFNKSDMSLYRHMGIAREPESHRNGADGGGGQPSLGRSYSLDDSEQLDRSLHLPHTEDLYGNHKRPLVPKTPANPALVNKMGNMEIGANRRFVVKKKAPQPAVPVKKVGKVVKDKPQPPVNSNNNKNKVAGDKRPLVKVKSLDQNNMRRISAAHGRHSVKPPSTVKPPERILKLTDKYTVAEYEAMASKTVNVMPFVKLAYPDVHSAFPNLPLQPLKLYPEALKKHVITKVEKNSDVQPFVSQMIYNLDELVATQRPQSGQLTNFDKELVGKRDPHSESLKFESRFESGNLRRVIQTGEFEYELYLTPDINQASMHFQWFYFHVSNMQSDVFYTFNLVNFVKSGSQFSQGMQPLVFSVIEALQGRPGWARSGANVVYHRNSYCLQSDLIQKDKAAQPGTMPRTFSTLSFCMSFRHAYDICYVSYHFPYTYTSLQCHLKKFDQYVTSGGTEGLYYKRQSLCQSVAKNDVPLLTITDRWENPDQLAARRYLFLSGRVHPGESNASWMMLGTLRFLLSNTQKAQELRRRFIFKIVPILNPDGVINGSHRCSLSGRDLNRMWENPSAILHPPVYHTKGLLEYMRSSRRPPYVFCDYHGHSRRKNVFMLGSNPKLSWNSDDVEFSHSHDFMALPQVLESEAPGFSLELCRFTIEKGKEGTGRVVAWRQFHINRAYTVEATFCGFDKGPYRGQQVGTRELVEMGERICTSILIMSQTEEHRRAEQADSSSDSEEEEFSGINLESDGSG